MTARTTSRKNAGFSLIEVIIAVAVLVLALIGLISVIVHTTHYNSVQRENLTAMREAERIIEEMMSTPFDEIFATYRTGGAVGPDFEIEGLLDADGTPGTGTIRFPVDDDTGVELLETETSEIMDSDADIDLNGNGEIDDEDVSDSYQLLPVVIDLQWSGISGPRILTYRHILMQR